MCERWIFAAADVGKTCAFERFIQTQEKDSQPTFLLDDHTHKRVPKQERTRSMSSLAALAPAPYFTADPDAPRLAVLPESPDGKPNQQAVSAQMRSRWLDPRR
jgi:hypothetical protein